MIIITQEKFSFPDLRKLARAFTGQERFAVIEEIWMRFSCSSLFLSFKRIEKSFTHPFITEEIKQRYHALWNVNKPLEGKSKKDYDADSLLQNYKRLFFFLHRICQELKETVSCGDLDQELDAFFWSLQDFEEIETLASVFKLTGRNFSKLPQFTKLQVFLEKAFFLGKIDAISRVFSGLKKEEGSFLFFAEFLEKFSSEEQSRLLEHFQSRGLNSYATQALFFRKPSSFQSLRIFFASLLNKKYPGIGEVINRLEDFSSLNASVFLLQNNKDSSVSFSIQEDSQYLGMHQVVYLIINMELEHQLSDCLHPFLMYKVIEVFQSLAKHKSAFKLFVEVLAVLTPEKQAYFLSFCLESPMLQFLYKSLSYEDPRTYSVLCAFFNEQLELPFLDTSITSSKELRTITKIENDEDLLEHVYSSFRSEGVRTYLAPGLFSAKRVRSSLEDFGVDSISDLRAFISLEKGFYDLIDISNKDAVCKFLRQKSCEEVVRFFHYFHKVEGGFSLFSFYLSSLKEDKQKELLVFCKQAKLEGYIHKALRDEYASTFSCLRLFFSRETENKDVGRVILDTTNFLELRAILYFTGGSSLNKDLITKEFMSSDVIYMLWKLGEIEKIKNIFSLLDKEKASSNLFLQFLTKLPEDAQLAILNDFQKTRKLSWYIGSFLEEDFFISFQVVFDFFKNFVREKKAFSVFSDIFNNLTNTEELKAFVFALDPGFYKITPFQGVDAILEKMLHFGGAFHVRLLFIQIINRPGAFSFFESCFIKKGLLQNLLKENILKKDFEIYRTYLEERQIPEGFTLLREAIYQNVADQFPEKDLLPIFLQLNTYEEVTFLESVLVKEAVIGNALGSHRIQWALRTLYEIGFQEVLFNAFLTSSESIQLLFKGDFFSKWPIDMLDSFCENMLKVSILKESCSLCLGELHLLRFYFFRQTVKRFPEISLPKLQQVFKKIKTINEVEYLQKAFLLAEKKEEIFLSEEVFDLVQFLDEVSLYDELDSLFCLLENSRFSLGFFADFLVTKPFEKQVFLIDRIFQNSRHHRYLSYVQEIGDSRFEKLAKEMLKSKLEKDLEELPVKPIESFIDLATSCLETTRILLRLDVVDIFQLFPFILEKRLRCALLILTLQAISFQNQKKLVENLKEECWHDFLLFIQKERGVKEQFFLRRLLLNLICTRHLNIDSLSLGGFSLEELENLRLILLFKKNKKLFFQSHSKISLENTWKLGFKIEFFAACEFLVSQNTPQLLLDFILKRKLDSLLVSEFVSALIAQTRKNLKWHTYSQEVFFNLPEHLVHHFYDRLKEIIEADGINVAMGYIRPSLLSEKFYSHQSLQKDIYVFNEFLDWASKRKHASVLLKAFEDIGLLDKARTFSAVEYRRKVFIARQIIIQLIKTKQPALTSVESKSFFALEKILEEATYEVVVPGKEAFSFLQRPYSDEFPIGKYFNELGLVWQDGESLVSNVFHMYYLSSILETSNSENRGFSSDAWLEYLTSKDKSDLRVLSNSFILGLCFPGCVVGMSDVHFKGRITNLLGTAIKWLSRPIFSSVLEKEEFIGSDYLCFSSFLRSIHKIAVRVHEKLVSLNFFHYVDLLRVAHDFCDLEFFDYLLCEISYAQFLVKLDQLEDSTFKRFLVMQDKSISESGLSVLLKNKCLAQFVRTLEGVGPDEIKTELITILEDPFYEMR